jgi:hypothetical protein
MTKTVDIRVLTSAERKAILGKVRQAHKKAFKEIEAAGAHACFIVSIVEVEGHPREPAVTCQAVRSKACTLSADDIQAVVARMLIHNWESMR